MNERANNLLLARDKIIPEMHLRQPGFLSSASGSFTKINKYGDLTRRTVSDKILRDKAFSIDKNLKYDGYQRGLASMVYKFFDKKSASLADKSASGSGIKSESI